MNSQSKSPYYAAQSSAAAGMFSTSTGKLGQQLCKGEYTTFEYAPAFESDFIQVSKREVVDMHNGARMVTVSTVRTSPTSHDPMSCCWPDQLLPVMTLTDPALPPSEKHLNDRFVPIACSEQPRIPM
ncbi:hypothetical protein MC885_000625, partial [Smutsia gigantea]